MAATATELRVKNLPRRQASALKRKAERLGLTVPEYVKELIEDDLAIDQKARRTPLKELAAPFRKALRGMTGEEIDHLVDRNRPSRRR